VPPARRRIVASRTEHGDPVLRGVQRTGPHPFGYSPEPLPKHRTRRLDPGDVLAGRTRPTAVELMDLIHPVNPTGRDLPPREAELATRRSRASNTAGPPFAARV
jgi:hypothetical protein